MIPRAWPLLLVVSLAPAAPEPPAAPAAPRTEPSAPVPEIKGGAASGTERTTSRSGQFLIRGSEPLLRGAVAALAEDAKNELLEITGGKEGDWKIPVIVELAGLPGDPIRPRSVALERREVEGKDQLYIHVHLSHGINIPEFKRAVTTALVYEHALRVPNPPALDVPLSVPPWLSEGLVETADWNNHRGDRWLYEGLGKFGGLYRASDLFATGVADYGNLDGASRAAFRASSGALVMSLAEQPDGKAAMAAFLSEIPSFQGEMPVLLRRHFPGLNLSEDGLAKWLALKLIDIAKPAVNEVLTIPETEALLAECLQIRFRDPATGLRTEPVSAWKKLQDLSTEERAEAVRQAQDGLVRLSYRCFPSYRPLLAEYQIILTDMARGRSKAIDASLAELQKHRNGMAARAERARDYLDNFEINTAFQSSGQFDEYRRLKARLDQAPTKRDDPLSSYLDLMERIYYRKTIAPPAAPGSVPLSGPVMSGPPGDLPPLPGNLPEHLPIDDRPTAPPAGPQPEVPIDLPKP